MAFSKTLVMNLSKRRDYCDFLPLAKVLTILQQALDGVDGLGSLVGNMK